MLDVPPAAPPPAPVVVERAAVPPVPPVLLDVPPVLLDVPPVLLDVPPVPPVPPVPSIEVNAAPHAASRRAAMTAPAPLEFRPIAFALVEGFTRVPLEQWCAMSPRQYSTTMREGCLPPRIVLPSSGMSGHSKWATIKHRKGAADAKRGKLFTKLIKELTVAARMGGGDIDGNPRLRKAVTEAKGSQMPNETIARAVKRGAGELDGEIYDEIVYEGTGPGGTLFLIEAMTDNRNRTVAELRKVFERHGGILAVGGAAMWAFEKKGLISVPGIAADEEKLMELTMDVGAENVEEAGDEWQVHCAVSDLDAVSTVLEKAGIKVTSAKPGYVPKTKKPLEGKDAETALSLFETLDDHDDAQNVYADFDVSDDELARLAGE